MAYPNVETAAGQQTEITVQYLHQGHPDKQGNVDDNTLDSHILHADIAGPEYFQHCAPPAKPIFHGPQLSTARLGASGPGTTHSRTRESA